MNAKMSIVVILISLSMTLTAKAELVVIANSASTVELDQKTVARVFLGKVKKLPGGTLIEAIDQGSESPIRADFLQSILKKSEYQVKAYWAKRLFTGKGRPPKQAGSDKEVVEQVANNLNLIGYVDHTALDERVRVVYK